LIGYAGVKAMSKEDKSMVNFGVIFMASMLSVGLGAIYFI
jgi:hypothetical protein